MLLAGAGGYWIPAYAGMTSVIAETNAHAPSFAGRAWGDGKIEIGAGIGLLREHEMPPFEEVVLEAVRLHGVAERNTVRVLLRGVVRGEFARFHIEAVEGRAHGEAAVRRLAPLRCVARPGLLRILGL